MSDTAKLRAIQEALDAQRALDLDALDGATRESAEQLARVDAWLRARPSSPAYAPSELDDPEALAARIEARLGDVLHDDFDPLAAPDFSDFGDELGDLDEPDASNVVSIGKARSASSSSTAAASSAAAAPAASRGLAPVPAASAPVAAKTERSTGGSSGAGRGSFARWFASAAVVLLAATGSFVAFRSASSPDAAETATAPAASPAVVSAEADVAPGATPTEPVARFALEAELAEEAPADRRRAENAQGVGGALPEGAVAGGEATGAAFEGTLDTTTRDAPREQLARARPSTRSTTSMPTISERGAADIWAPAAPTAAAPVTSARTTSVSTQMATAAAPSREVADPAANEEAAVAEDETGLVRIERWRARVLSCVPAIGTLTTRVEARDGRVSAVLETTPALDAATRGCVETALRGAPLDRTRATLRWTRER